MRSNTHSSLKLYLPHELTDKEFLPARKSALQLIYFHSLSDFHPCDLESDPGQDFLVSSGILWGFYSNPFPSGILPRDFLASKGFREMYQFVKYNLQYNWLDASSDLAPNSSVSIILRSGILHQLSTYQPSKI
ncbi:hypothetical protein CEXT_567441 [Caerostris extrusa]|uniref:Maturase K n=1 Tax=Caerostris extrusa TaxID=172846 RepID=A0AAV4T9C8_CAEEX|nr:hypothetical protein CEXT_567441 [Caerostris extrusa]